MQRSEKLGMLCNVRSAKPNSNAMLAGKCFPARIGRSRSLKTIVTEKQRTWFAHCARKRDALHTTSAFTSVSNARCFSVTSAWRQCSFTMWSIMAAKSYIVQIAKQPCLRKSQSWELNCERAKEYASVFASSTKNIAPLLYAITGKGDGPGAMVSFLWRKDCSWISSTHNPHGGWKLGVENNRRYQYPQSPRAGMGITNCCVVPEALRM